jgi:hypothetical protein
MMKMRTVLIIICVFLIIIGIFTITLCFGSNIDPVICSIFNHGQIIEYSTLVNKYPRLEHDKPIYIVYHIATIGEWRKIVTEQMDTLKESGLYDMATEIRYGCNCAECPSKLKRYFDKYYPKVKPLENALIPDKKTYENGTINAMLDFLREREPGYVMYFHSKGVTSRSSSQHTWRKYMMYWMVTHHLECIDILSRGFNTVGPCHVNVKGMRRFYAGNFWWCRSDYLIEKKPIVNMSDRFQAEWFLLENLIANKNVCLENKTYMLPYIHDYSINEPEYKMVIF